jgi:golgin subfamily B member 1
MSAQTIRTALGLLQDDPDIENAWNDLQDAATSPDPGLEASELSKLLEAARRAHEGRREWDAAARLLELEVAIAAGKPDEPLLQSELARILDDEIVDDAGATAAYKRLLELLPDDATAAEAIERSATRRAGWKAMVDQYMLEVAESEDAGFRSSLLMGAAELAYRFGRSEGTTQIVQRLENALAADKKNRRAALLLERIYRTEGQWEDAARVLEILALEADSKEDRQAAFVRRARIFSRKMSAPERALEAYEHVLDMTPGHPEAMSYLAQHFSEKGDWDHLVALYEDQMRGGGIKQGQELGTFLQIAMVHWRMRGKPEAAEPWFERVRKVEPAHPGMLNFFREYLEEKGQRPKLLAVLTDAQRALPDGDARAALSTEIAEIAEGDANAGKAIEQYKAILRSDPANAAARDALKRLYTQTEAWNALVELLKQELERTAAEDRDGRLRLMNEIARLYRQHIKSDTALVQVLQQIVALDEQDIEAIHELVRVYEALSRWRDLLTYQQKLADLLTDTDQKISLYRAVARRWLDQFSNVGNGVEAYEALLRVDPRDEEARTKLRELYNKRRAWAQLFSLSEKELEVAEGAGKIELLVEMAKLAAERLDRGADAIRLYKEALALDESASGVLDSLEKQAERDKDFATVAEVLERRVELASDDAARLQVLQKLGSVYADRLTDPVGAARAWRRVLALSPGHAKALRVLRDSYLASGDLESLEELYASQNDWEGLAEVLSTAADKSTDPEQKVRYSLRSAKVYEERIEQRERGARSYERILSVLPQDERSARALVPIYEQEEKWARLPSLYEILLGHATGTDERVSLHRKLAEVSGQRLSDRQSAVVHARKAYELDPTAEGALEFLEASAREASAWGALTDAIQWRLEQGDAITSEDRRSLRARLADVYANQLGKVDEAVVTYRSLVEENPADEETVSTLDTILRGAGRRDDLRWLFELRAGISLPETRAKLFDEWATLEEEVFGEPAKAVELYKRVLEIAPHEASALSALGRLLLASGDAAAAGEVMIRRRDLAEGSDRAERELDLAELSAGPLNQPEAALEAAVRALELSPRDARAIRMLERLVEVPTTRPSAAEVLQAQYEQNGDAEREAQALGVMLETTTEPAKRLPLYAKLADVHERKLSAPGTALDVVLRAVAEYPDELVLWDRAADLSTAAGRHADLARALQETLGRPLPEGVEVELCERAAMLHDERLGDPQGAVPFLDRVLSRQPTNERAFGRLKQILTGTERWAQLETLYEHVVAASQDATRKVDLLAEVALVCEDITVENAKAISYYERILELDPLHEQALKSLDKLYQAEKRPRQLSQLLERRLTTATSEETIAFKLRLGRLHFEELAEPQIALAHLEEVLTLDPASAEARDLVEGILQVPELRPRSAEVLEQVYETRDDARNLVRVLEIRLDGAGNDDLRRDLLRRIAQLRDQRLQDDAGSLEALARLVPLDPTDALSRARLLDIGRRLEAHQRVADVLLVASENAEAKERKAEILMEIAKIYEDLISDRAKAEETYRRVVALDPTDPSLVLPAARALERIYEGAANPRALAEMLRLEVQLEASSDARSELWGRLGDLCENVLEDPAGAIAAWRARLEEDPADDRALGALERLYEKTSAWRELVQTLKAREQVSGESSERRRLMTKAAETLSSKLGDTQEAILSWRTVVDEFGPDRGTLAALAALYETAESWHDLGTTLETDLTLAGDDDARLALHARLGDVRRMYLEDLPGALEAYRQALIINPSHGASRLSLELMLEVPAARREAAEILHPLYEGDGDHERLLRVLDIEVETSESPTERLGTLETAVRVAEGPLTDPARAFGYATRGVREAVSDESLPRWLERLEALTSATGRYAELVTVLSEVSNDVLDSDVQLQMRIRIAELARERLGDRALARDWYQKALALRGDDRRALIALESLYEEMGDAPALLEILKRRVEVANDDGERRELLYRQAKLTREVIADKGEAIKVYEAVLELGLDNPAVAALEQLYAEEARFQDLVGLYERQIQEGSGDTADLHVKLAAVAERNLGDTSRAFEELEDALGQNPQHAGAIAALERLLEEGRDPEHRARAGEMLEPVYLRRADWKAVMRALGARLAASQDPSERRTLLKRLSQLHEEQEEDYKAALETQAKLLHEDSSDEETWGELERLAKMAEADARLAEIYAEELGQVVAEEPHTAKLSRRTGELYAQLGDVDKALVFYRRALAFQPESRDLFSAVDGLLINAKRPAERVELYRQALDHRFEPADRLSVLHTIADLEENALSEIERAIDTYRAALDVEERDGRSLDALTRLYRSKERWRDLSELYLRRADLDTDGDASAGYRLALARLYKNQLTDVGAAIDQLEIIVEAMPWNKDAIAELEKLSEDPDHKARVVEILDPLYKRSDDWSNQIRLNEQRLSLAQDVIEKISILRSSAQLFEEKARDPLQAFDAIRKAFALDPEEEETRADLDRLAQHLKAWDALAESYEQAIEQTGDPTTKRELLQALAEVHDKRRDDLRKALGAYDRLFALDETEMAPLEQMDGLALMLSDWPALVRVLGKKAELVSGDDERAALWRQIGGTRRDMMEDTDGAITAYEQAFELDPESVVTADCLIDLYEQKDDARRLVELYRRRVELAADDESDLRYNLLLRMAERYEKKLSNRRDAIEALREALLVRPGDRDALRWLDRLFREEELWPDLLENLRLQAASAETTDERVQLRRAMGDLYRQKLDDPFEALDAYRQVLDEAPSDDAAIAAAREIGETRDDLRSQAADILDPILRIGGRFADLVAILELRLRAQIDPLNRAQTLRTIAIVEELNLNHPLEAERALIRALAESADNEDIHAEIERLAAANGYERYADALTERAAAMMDANVSRDLYTRLGRIAEEQLKDDARAIKALCAAVEQAGDTAPLLVALDRLYSRTNDATALADVLERRVNLEDDTTARADLYNRLATIQIKEFNDARSGLATLRLTLESKQDHAGAREALEGLTSNSQLFDEAAETLDGVYRSLGDHDRLASLLERKVQHAQSARDRIRIRLELARVLEEQAKDAKRAQRVLEGALADDPSDPDVLTELERLTPITGEFAPAAAALDKAIAGSEDLLPEAARDLYVRLAEWYRDRLTDRQSAEAAFERALTKDPESLDILRALEDLRRVPGRERELVDTLRRRAKLETDLEQKRTLLREAKGLAETQVKDDALAEAVLRQLLEENDADLWALENLTALREKAGDSKEATELLLRWADLVGDGAEIARLRHRAAEMMRDKLSDAAGATKLYEDLFENDPNDTRASAALRVLYDASNKTSDLSRLLERLIDVATSPSERTTLRIELAKLQAGKLKAPDDAIDTLRAVLDEEPGQASVVVELSQLYEKAGKDDDLADLLNSQIELARDRGDLSGELAFKVRLGEIYEGRLRDTAKAIETYQGVLERDPNHKGALYAVARLHTAKSAISEAITALEKLLDLEQGQEVVPVALQLAEAHIKQKNDDGARRALERALSIDAANADVRGQLRALYERVQDWSKLADLIAGDAEAAGTPAEQVRLYKAAAVIQREKRDDAAAAAALLEKASALAPEERELLLALCDAYNASGRGKDSIRTLERIKDSFGGKRSKELAGIHQRLAQAYLAESDKEKALSELDSSFKIDPGSVATLRDLGMLTLEMGDLDRANKTFRALLLQKLDPPAPITKAEVFFYLGDISNRQGDKPKAIQMLERSVENDGKLDKARELLAQLKSLPEGNT